MKKLSKILSNISVFFVAIFEIVSGAGPLSYSSGKIIPLWLSVVITLIGLVIIGLLAALFFDLYVI